MTTRGERIWQKARNVARWLRIFRAQRSQWSNESDEHMQLRAKRASQHGVMCSCLMCGNARNHSGDTMQERRAKLSEDDTQ